MTPREALDRITALCNQAERDRIGYDGSWMVRADVVRAVLAEVSPEPGGVLDRDALLDLFRPYSAAHLGSGKGSLAEWLADRIVELAPPGGGVLDRDQARPIVRDAIDNAANTERTLDRLAGCVRPAAIDRDALVALIHRIQEETDGDADLGDWTPQYVAEFLALVRPVAGVVLTPEEADLVRRLVTRDPRTPWSTRDNARLPALAARLEAAP